MLRIALILLVIFHLLIVVFTTIGFFILPFREDWYVWLPIEVFVARLMIDGRVNACPLNVVENWIRRKLKWPTLKSSFVSHYIFRFFRKKKNVEKRH